MKKIFIITSWSFLAIYYCLSQTNPSPVDWYHNPFNKNSAHHRPIGTGAEYSSDDDTLTKLWQSFFSSPNTRGNINQAHPFGAPFVLEDESYPLETVIGRNCDDSSDDLISGSQPFPVQRRIPPNYVTRYNYNPQHQCHDNLAVFFDPGSMEIHELFRFNRNLSTGQYRAAFRRPPHRIDGLGHGEVLGQKVGPPAAGMSAVFGLLRKAVLETPGQPIDHALQVGIPGLPHGPQPQLLGRKIQWPATTPDGFANRADRCTGLFAYGMLIALPPESKGGPNLDDLNLSDPGRRLAECIRDYGMYVIDQAGAVALRSDEPLGPLLAPVRGDFRKILPYCRVVTNSVTGATAEISVGGSWPGTGFIGTPTGSDGKTWPAGGGVPLAPNTALDATATSLYETEITSSDQGIFSIYPNPTDNSITLTQNRLSGITEVEVLNLSGQSIKKIRFSGLQTELKLPERDGLYLIRVNSDRETETFKVIKN